MNEVDFQVKQAILNYTNQFEGRADVLIYMFNMDEYFWENGSLVNICPPDALTKCDRLEWDSRLGSPDLAYRKNSHKLDFIDENIDEIVETKEDTSYHNFSSDYWTHDICFSNFINTPEDIKLEWRDALFELSGIWKRYYFTKSSIHTYDIIKFDDDGKLSVEVKYYESPLSENCKNDIICYNMIVDKVNSLKSEGSYK